MAEFQSNGVVRMYGKNTDLLDRHRVRGLGIEGRRLRFLLSSLYHFPWHL